MNAEHLRLTGVTRVYPPAERHATVHALGPIDLSLRQGEFFSKGLHHSVKGMTDWASYETPFYLMKGQRPDLIKLNLVFEGAGTVWIKDVELLQTPLE